MIDCVKNIHETGFIHADIKVDNFMVDVKNQVHLIDYGNCQRIKNSDGTHRLMTSKNRFFGNVKCASKNALNGLTLSKRDDMI